MKIRVFTEPMKPQEMEVDNKFGNLLTIPGCVDDEIEYEIMEQELRETISAKFPDWQVAETMDGDFLL